MNDQREQAIRAALDQHEDAVLEYPQSGERTRGRRNIQSQRASRPGLAQPLAQERGQWRARHVFQKCLDVIDQQRDIAAPQRYDQRSPAGQRAPIGGVEQRATTDHLGVAAFRIELPMRVSCPFPRSPQEEDALSAVTTFAPEERRAPQEPTHLDDPQWRPVERYIHLVRKVELAHPEWSNATVVGALRAVAGYDNTRFQDLYDLPPQPKLGQVEADWGAAAPGARRLVVHCREHRIEKDETFEGIARDL